MRSVDFSVVELSAGAEIQSLDRANPIGEQTTAELNEAWLRYGFLLFRDVDSVERHLELSRCFGELVSHPMVQTRSALDPLLVDVGRKNSVRSYVFDDGVMRANRLGWHRDTVFTRDICQGSMLRMVDVTTTEGETMLADTAAAYDELPSALKERLEGMEYIATLGDPIMQARTGAFWKTARPAAAEEDFAGPREAGSSRMTQTFQPVVHPAVIVHPHSRRKCIFISPSHAEQFIGMARSESDELLRTVVDHMLGDRFVYKHVWRNNDAIIWDNWRMLHAAFGHTPDQPRWGLRSTLAASHRFGRYLEASEQESLHKCH